MTNSPGIVKVKVRKLFRHYGEKGFIPTWHGSNQHIDEKLKVNCVITYWDKKALRSPR